MKKILILVPIIPADISLRRQDLWILNNQTVSKK